MIMISVLHIVSGTSLITDIYHEKHQISVHLFFFLRMDFTNKHVFQFVLFAWFFWTTSVVLLKAIWNRF